MEYCMPLIVCLFVAFPLTTGLKCFSCIGVGAGDCLNNAMKGKITEKICPTPSGNNVAKCSKTSVETAGIMSITRDCAEVPAGTAEGCSTQTVLLVDTNLCYCSGDICNGQTTLTPASVLSVVSLLLALYLSK